VALNHQEQVNIFRVFTFLSSLILFFCWGKHLQKHVTTNRNTQSQSATSPLGGVRLLQRAGRSQRGIDERSRRVNGGSCSRAGLWLRLPGAACQSNSSESYLTSCMISLRASLFLMILEHTAGVRLQTCLSIFWQFLLQLMDSPLKAYGGGGGE